MTSQMAREVAEIPQAARRFLDLSAGPLREAAGALRQAEPRMLLTVARGSSDHAATVLKYAAEMLAGIPVASIGPSVASIYGRPLALAGAGCIGISQSGQSPDIVQMMQAARQGGALTVAITNHGESPLAAAAAHCLPLQAGAETAVAATKTFVCSVLAGLALLAEWRQDRALQEAVAATPEAMERALALDWSPLSARLARAQSAYVLGRGPAIGIAAEAALKLKETCGLHAEGFSAAEVLHGPAAIVHSGFPVLALAVDDEALPHVVQTAERLAAQGADVFLTGAQAKGAVTLPGVDGVHPLLAPLVLAVAFYAFVETLSRRRGFDPDTPPHLRKVTETL
ncbi:SIS domain-containing protein [Rhodobacter sp. SGA-6-6]|uniref:SIS domain-containing protein n=1 Tax=Rhodobacter sp. SGA-6-6 TaxID=2710882 RepID=UPI0013EADA95|nr:SIS domain-containing protein [Rhodobacter sp. SGA-6-6]NGM44426.1 SIS domain-containing protein [Rhodobacter sp. SGA-6-6]